MGRAFVSALEQSELWEVSAVYDISSAARQLARQNVPNAAVYEAPEPIFADPSIDVVGLFTLADARPQQIHRALACGKHVLAEKPLGADVTRYNAEFSRALCVRAPIRGPSLRGSHGAQPHECVGALIIPDRVALGESH
jgi:Oxidoreductase family, NAD-binding Rossmann fold